MNPPSTRNIAPDSKARMESVDLPQLLKDVVAVVITAGEKIKAEWSRIDGPRGHGAKAAVDIEIEQELRKNLLTLLAADFWGEETGSSLTGHPLCWVIDPNDGTSDFLRGIKGSAVSVGLLRDRIPVLGVVYAPVTENLGGDCIGWAEGMDSISRNGKETMCALEDRAIRNGDQIMVSAAASKAPAVNAELCAPGQFVAMPSIAYRLARVAAGDGVCAVSLYPVAAHDVVAGHALLRAVGGVLTDENGQEVTYTTKQSMEVVSQRCFGGAPVACASLRLKDWQRVFLSPLLGAPRNHAHRQKPRPSTSD